MTQHKLEITPVLNGYELYVKDVTGFGPNGYSEDSLNVNNVLAILLVLKDSVGKVMNSVRVEGTDKNNFMAGLHTINLKSADSMDTWPEFSPGLYTVESYLIQTQTAVKGLANYSEVTGTGLGSVVKDNVLIDVKEVYQVIPGYTNGGTVLQLATPLKRFINQASFGNKFSFQFAHYTNAVNVLFNIANMRLGVLQKDGESENYLTLSGHITVIDRSVALGSTDNLEFILRDTAILAAHLNNKYFRY